MCARARAHPGHGTAGGGGEPNAGRGRTGPTRRAPGAAQVIVRGRGPRAHLECASDRCLYTGLPVAPRSPRPQPGRHSPGSGGSLAGLGPRGLMPPCPRLPAPGSGCRVCSQEAGRALRAPGGAAPHWAGRGRRGPAPSEGVVLVGQPGPRTALGGVRGPALQFVPPRACRRILGRSLY